MISSPYLLISLLPTLISTLALPAPQINPTFPFFSEPIPDLPSHSLQWTPSLPYSPLPKELSLRLLFGFQHDISKRKGQCSERVQQHNDVANIYVEPNEHYRGRALSLPQVSLGLFLLWEKLVDAPMFTEGMFEIVDERRVQVVRGLLTEWRKQEDGGEGIHVPEDGTPVVAGEGAAVVASN